MGRGTEGLVGLFDEEIVWEPEKCSQSPKSWVLKSQLEGMGGP